MPNRYRLPLVLLKLESNQPPSDLLEHLEVGTHQVFEYKVSYSRKRREKHVFNLVGLGAN